MLLRLAHDSILSALRRARNPTRPANASSRRTSRSLYVPLPAWRAARLRGLCPASDSGVSRGRRYRAGRRFRRHALPSSHTTRSVATRNRAQHPFAAAIDFHRSDRNRTPWPAHQLGGKSRPAAAPGAHRAQLGTHNLPGTNLPQSWPASGCLEKGATIEAFTAEVFGEKHPEVTSLHLSAASTCGVQFWAVVVGIEIDGTE